VHLALKPTPIDIVRWRPEPRQNLRHLAARKARPRRRAALGLIHRHRHNHHPFAAACAYGGSLRRPPEATVSGKRARCALCSSRASTTKLSRRLPSTRSPARRGTPRRSLRGPPGRRVELLAAIAPRELVEAIVSGRPRGEWRVRWLRARLLLVSGTCLSVDLEQA
jgi:hypothetical protein